MPTRKHSFLIGLSGFIAPFLALVVGFFYFNYFDYKVLASYFFLLVFFIAFQALIQKRLVYLIILLLNSLLFASILFLELTHWSLFNYAIAESTVHIVLESPQSEMSEFLSAYLKPSFIGLAIGFLFFIVLGLIISSQKTLKLNKSSCYLAMLISIGVILIFRFSFLPYITARSIYTYNKERQALNEVKIDKYGHFKNVINHSTASNETVVLLIGESTTRTHMGIYDYYRQTTPLLSQKSPELAIYNQVVSPHSHTVESLGKALTLDFYETPSKKYNKTIVQLFNSAKYETYWISNQKPFGTYETSTRLISKMSDKSIFTKMTTVMPDEVVIPHFKKVLNEKFTKKFIIIHLLGTHSKYSNRYPMEYNVFNSRPQTKFKHSEAFETINEYDNAVLYNDYVVSTIIDELAKQNSPSYLVYFSDHGEDVYETIDQACHTEIIGTPPMFKVPFIIWYSEEHQAKDKKLDAQINREYNLTDLIHTIADISTISFDGYHPQSSILYSDTTEDKSIINEVY